MSIYSDAKRDADAEAERITFVNGDATSLSFSDMCFDVVLSPGILAELTPGSIEKLHAFRNFKAVDLNWLERELDSLV